MLPYRHRGHVTNNYIALISLRWISQIKSHPKKIKSVSVTQSKSTLRITLPTEELVVKQISTYNFIQLKFKSSYLTITDLKLSNSVHPTSLTQVSVYLFQYIHPDIHRFESIHKSGSIAFTHILPHNHRSQSISFNISYLISTDLSLSHSIYHIS